MSLANFPSLAAALEVATLPGTTNSRGRGRPSRPSNPAVALATLAIFNHLGGNVSATARAIDIHRKTVDQRLKRARGLQAQALQG